MSLDSGSRRDGASSSTVDFTVDDLAVDVFDVDASGLTVESLTGGHGMNEVGASCTTCVCTCSCCCIAEN